MNKKLENVVKQMAKTYNDPEHLSNILMLKGCINEYLEDFTHNEMIDALSDCMGEIASNIDQTSSSEFIREFDEDDTDIYTIEEFTECVEIGGFNDYDGCGCAAKDGKKTGRSYYPSEIDEIPEDATHIVWYNKELLPCRGA